MCACNASKLLLLGGSFTTPQTAPSYIVLYTLFDLHRKSTLSTGVAQWYSGAVHHHANTTVWFACFTYTIHSVVER